MRQKRFSFVTLLTMLGLLLAACGGTTANQTTSVAATAAPPAGTAAPEVATTAAPAAVATTAAPAAVATTAAPAAAATTAAPADTTAATTAAPEETATEDETTTAAAETTAGTTASAAATGGTGGTTGTTDYAAIGPELAAAFAGEHRGKTVSISHGLSGEENEKFIAQFADFQEQTGITVRLVPGGTVEANAVKFESGTIEDIVNFPQPGTMGTYARQGKIVDLNKVITPAWLTQNYNQGFLDTNTVQDASGNPMLGGIFNRINFKSAVWYPKDDFEEAGYEIPETWDEMIALMDQIVADGDTPWCIGIGSDAATGWPATDWLEDIMLRTTSLENYDKWTRGELPFTDPIVKNALQRMTDIWFQDKYVFGGRQSIATTAFGDAPTPMFDDPPKCWMHKQGNFITTFFETNAPGVEAGVDYDFFYLPPIDPQYGEPVLFAGDLFSVTNDRPEVRAVIQYLSTYESLAPWIKLGGGALAPHKNAVLSDFTNDIERNMTETILNASSARFDGGDLMPSEVGSGSFWKGMTDYVSGSANIDQALETIQNGWANVQR